MGTLKCVCSYLSRDIKANQLEHTLLRVPIRGTSDQLCVCSYQLGRFLVEKLAIYFRLKVGKILST